MTRFNPGDVVMVADKIEAVILYEYDPMRCMCDDKDCYEWANLLIVDGGGWLMHVKECDMRLSHFGRRLKSNDWDSEWRSG